MRLGFACRYVPTMVRVYPDTEEIEEYGGKVRLDQYGTVLVAGVDTYNHNRKVAERRGGTGSRSGGRRTLVEVVDGGSGSAKDRSVRGTGGGAETPSRRVRWPASRSGGAGYRYVVLWLVGRPSGAAWSAAGRRGPRCRHRSSCCRQTAFDDLPVFERVISEWLALADWMTCVEAMSMDDGDEVRQAVAEVLADSFDTLARKTVVASVDGVPLNVYAAGQGDETVVLVPACGMPAVLAESWIRFLARNRRVLTWESRGLFGDSGADRNLRPASPRRSPTCTR